MAVASRSALLITDWERVTNANNPFKAAGAAACDPSSKDEDSFYVSIGITKHVVRLAQDFMLSGRSQHFSVVAPLGYGKSRSFAAAMHLAKAEFPDTISVYIKFSSYRTHTQGSSVEQELVSQIVAQVARFLDQSPSSLADQMERKNAGPVSAGQVLDLLASVVPRSHKISIYVDEVEKLIEAKDMPFNEKVGVINLFKEWADKAKRRVNLALALTPPTFDWMVNNLPDVVQRFEQLPDIGLLPDETEAFIEQKCNLALGVTGRVPFTDEVIDLIHRLSQGIPRVIESISHECWARAAIRKQAIDATEFKRLIRDVYGLIVKDVCRSYGLPDREIALINDLLYNGGQAALRELRQPQHPTYKSLYRSLYRLAQRGVIVRRSSHGVYAILPEFLDEIMRRKYKGFRGAGVS